MANKGAFRGVGPRGLLDYVWDRHGRKPVAGDPLVYDKAAKGNLRFDSTRYVATPSGMSFLSQRNGLRPQDPANTRRAAQCITAGDGPFTSTAYTDTNFRAAFVLPVTPTRFRLKWVNQSATFNGALGSGTGAENGQIVFTGMYLGAPNIPASAPPTAWAGDFAAAPVQVAAGATVGGGGSQAIYTSPWWDNVGSPLIAARQPVVASIGFTQSSIPIYIAASGAFTAVGSGCSSDAGTAAWNAHGGAVTYAPVGCWMIEFEWAGDNPIGLWIGDSIMAGATGLNWVNPQPMEGPMTRFPERVGQRLGHIVENAAVSGEAFTAAVSDGSVGNGSFNNDFFYTRFWLDNPANAAGIPTVPDYAVIQLGTNDIQRWDNTAATKLAFSQLVQTLRQGFGIQRVFALTIPPGIATAFDAWSRHVQAGQTSGSTTFKIDQLTAFDSALYTLTDSLSTTVNQSGTLNSTNFTGTQTLTLTSASTANAGGGYAQVGGTGGCIIRYTAKSGNNLLNVLFVKGNPVTLSAGSTAIIGAVWLTIEAGGDANSVYEHVYYTATPSYSSAIGTVTLALAGTTAQTHQAGALVCAKGEAMRQRLNGWLRQGPPGVDATIDIALATEFGEYSATGSGGMLVTGTTQSQGHPYYWAITGGTSSLHPMSAAWHNYIASLVSAHLVGI